MDLPSCLAKRKKVIHEKMLRNVLSKISQKSTKACEAIHGKQIYK